MQVSKGNRSPVIRAFAGMTGERLPPKFDSSKRALRLDDRLR